MLRHFEFLSADMPSKEHLALYENYQTNPKVTVTIP